MIATRQTMVAKRTQSKLDDALKEMSIIRQNYNRLINSPYFSHEVDSDKRQEDFYTRTKNLENKIKTLENTNLELNNEVIAHSTQLTTERDKQVSQQSTEYVQKAMKYQETTKLIENIGKLTKGLKPIPQTDYDTLKERFDSYYQLIETVQKGNKESEDKYQKELASFVRCNDDLRKSSNLPDLLVKQKE